MCAWVRCSSRESRISERLTVQRTQEWKREQLDQSFCARSRGAQLMFSLFQTLLGRDQKSILEAAKASFHRPGRSVQTQTYLEIYNLSTLEPLSALKTTILHPNYSAACIIVGHARKQRCHAKRCCMSREAAPVDTRRTENAPLCVAVQ
jgi:hypothetical protein